METCENYSYTTSSFLLCSSFVTRGSGSTLTLEGTVTCV